VIFQCSLSAVSSAASESTKDGGGELIKLDEARNLGDMAKELTKAMVHMSVMDARAERASQVDQDKVYRKSRRTRHTDTDLCNIARSTFEEAGVLECRAALDDGKDSWGAAWQKRHVTLSDDFARQWDCCMASR
jgi:hypothetical protein